MNVESVDFEINNNRIFILWAKTNCDSGIRFVNENCFIHSSTFCSCREFIALKTEPYKKQFYEHGLYLIITLCNCCFGSHSLSSYR